jgi:hypothetical protein
MQVYAEDTQLRKQFLFSNLSILIFRLIKLFVTKHPSISLPFRHYSSRLQLLNVLEINRRRVWIIYSSMSFDAGFDVLAVIVMKVSVF